MTSGPFRPSRSFSLSLNVEIEMALVSFPTPQYSSRLISHSLSYISLARNPQNLSSQTRFKAYVLGSFNSPISHYPLIHSSFSSRPRRLALVPALVPFDAKNSESGEEDHRALETVLKLYSAIKNKSINELSDLIGDECRCICNFFSFFQPFQGKMQVLEFFSYLIRSFGDNAEFVIKPTFHDGMKVGISWKLEWKNTHVPLGKGLSFYICHIYQGKVYIRNMEMFMEPLLYIEPLRMILMGSVMAAMEKMDFYTESKNKAKRVIFVFLALFLIGASLFLFKLTFHSS